MVDITLSSDRIRTAPIEVRRWIENELAESLGMRAPVPLPVHHERLVPCAHDELAQIFDFVRGMPPVVNVLLELGRETGTPLPNKTVMFRLRDIAAHAHLQSASQVGACAKILNEALQELRGDNDVLMCAVDDEERCYIGAETQAGIREVWRALVAAHEQMIAARPIAPTAAPPYAIQTPTPPQETLQDKPQDQNNAA
jgi:hypothetical protein